MQYSPHPSAGIAGVLRKLIALALAALFFVLALSFSLLLLGLLFVAGAAAWGYFWWKTRRFRKLIREPAAGGAVMKGETIEGEVVRETVTIEGQVVSRYDSRDQRP